MDPPTAEEDGARDTETWNPMVWCSTKLSGKRPSIKNHSATLVGSKLYIFGGYDGKKNHNNIHILDCSSYEWSTLKGIAGKIPAGRNGHTATLANGQIFIIGGWLGKGPLAARDMHIFDIPLKKWIEPETYGETPGPCNMHSADYLKCRNEILVFRGGDGRAYLNDLHALDIDTMNWQLLHPQGRIPVARANHDSCVVGDQLYIFGGWDGQKRLNDIHVLNAKDKVPTWSTPQNLEQRPQARAGMTLTAVRGKIFLFGGSGPQSKCYDDLHVYDPDRIRWLETATIENDDSADHGGTQVDRNEMDGASYKRRHKNRQDEAMKLAKKVRYRAGAYKEGNPNAEPERADVTILRKGPSERSGHTATLVGRKLLIFGGSHGHLSEYYDDFYELDTDPPPHISITNVSSTAMFQRSLYQFLDKPQFSDVTFIVQGKPVYAHKIVLCLMSERFRAMFSSGFREEREREIVIPDVSYHIFMRLLTYLYTGEPPELLVAVGENRIDQNIFAESTNPQEKISNAQEDDESEASSSFEEDVEDKDSDIWNKDDEEDDDFDLMQTNFDVLMNLDDSKMVNAQRGLKDEVVFNEHSIEDIALLLEAADKYMLDHLKQCCESSLQYAVNKNNAEALLRKADQCNATQLRLVCEHFLRNYNTQVGQV